MKTFCYKINMGRKKTEFDADFESDGKVSKTFLEKKVSKSKGITVGAESLCR
jgi:hypothetical protein